MKTVAQQLEEVYIAASRSVFNEGQQWQVVAKKAWELFTLRILNACTSLDPDPGVEECASEKQQYRMLEVGEVLQATDEVNLGPKNWVQLGDCHSGKRVTNTASFPVGFYRRPLSPSQQEVIDDQRFQIRDLEGKLETERHRLAACGVVALADTPESAAEARKMLHEYHSASCGDVERRVDECMDLRRKLHEREATIGRLQAKLERIEKATQRLRGYKEINSHDPAVCIVDAAAMIQKLQRQLKVCQTAAQEAVDGWNKDPMEMKRKLDAAANYIEKLKQDLSFYNTVADLFKTKLESAAHGE